MAEFQISPTTRALVQATLDYIAENVEDSEVNTNVDEFLNNDSTRVFIEVLLRIAEAAFVRDEE